MSNLPFVCREAELERLHALLGRAVAGAGQVAFLSGSAGTGKTALVRAFVAQAEAAHPDLLAVVGVCDAATGMDDPYLPFREALAMLAGVGDERRTALSPESGRRVQHAVKVTTNFLLDFGPDLVNIFVPFGKLAGQMVSWGLKKSPLIDKLNKAGKAGAGAPGAAAAPAVTQSEIFEQYANVLRAVAARTPLLLILDDLQWADAASLALLFRLTRRLEEARVLLLGAYRPEETAGARTSTGDDLEKVLTEIKRYRGDVVLDLNRAAAVGGRTFVDAYLDAEPNRFDARFRDRLYAQTRGHPLFTVELLRAMQERGEIVRTPDGAWQPGAALDWQSLPTRTESVIEVRVERLPPAQREVLTVAGVEGELFTAEVVARASAREPRAVVGDLSGALQKEHLLVTSLDVQRVGGQRLSRYQFSHNLIRVYLYESLDAVERSYLHEEVGSALEALYGAEAASIAVQLAHHFRAADLPARALPYLLRAGEQAAAAFANEAAITHFSAALELLPPDAPERGELLLKLGRLQRLVGHTSAAADYYRQAAALAERSGDRAALARSWLGLGAVARLATEFDDAERALARACSLFSELGDRAGQAETLDSESSLARERGDYVTARSSAEQALALYRELGNQRGEVTALLGLGTIAAEEDRAAALGLFEQGLAIARAVEDRALTGTALGYVGELLSLQGEYAAARARLAEASALWREMGNRWQLALVLLNLGCVALWEGNHPEAKSFYIESLAIAGDVRDRWTIVFLLEYTARLAHADGRAADALLLLGAAGVLREVMEAPLPPADQAELDALTAELLDRLSEEEAAQAFETGATLTLDETLAAAQRVLAA